MANKKLKNSLKKFSGQKEEKLVTITGELGIPLGGQKIVEVPNRNGFVYVRLKSNTSEIIQAYNSEVSTIYGLPVLVARQGNIYKVIGRNLDRYRDWSDIPYLPKHGGQHSFNFSLGMGADVSWIYSQQIMPLLSYPSGTQGSMVLALEPHFYEWEGQWRYAQNTGTPSYTPYLPTITGSARMVLSYLDPSDNSIKLVAGTPFSNTITGSAQLAQYIPDIPRSVGIPLAAVRLVTGTTAIGWGNIYDIRDFYTVSPSITGSTFNGIAVQDEGIPLGTGTVFNFVGANIDATISGSVVRVFVTGSSGGLPNPFALPADITPAAIAADQNNYNPAGLSTADVLRLEASGANRSITGLQGGADGRILIIMNIGSTYNLALLNEDSSSSAANRFSTGGYGVNIVPGASIILQYDATASRWKVLNTSASALQGAAITTTLRSALQDGDTIFWDASSSFFDRTPRMPVTGSVVYQDDYVTKGSALVFNFRTGLLASASGTNAQIDVEFGTGTYQVPYGNHNHLSGNGGTVQYVDVIAINCVVGTNTVAASSTSYAYPGVATMGGVSGTVWPVGGTMKSMNVRLSSAQPASGSLVVTLQKNLVDTALVITIPAGSSGSQTFSDLTHTVTFVAGDIITWKIVNNATATSGSLTTFSMSLERGTS